MKAYITVGISASGKTTWAKEFAEGSINHTIIVSRDDARRQILEERFKRSLAPGELWGKWKWKDEGEVTDICNALIKTAAKVGADLIIADTNLNQTRRMALTVTLEDLGYEVEIKKFPISFEDAVKRDNGRADGVGQSVLMTQWLQYQAEFGGQKYVPCTDMPKAIMCDVDGTLAHMDGRGPFDWSRVGEDTLDEDVAMILAAYKAKGVAVIIMSGRDSVCRNETEQWLEDKGVDYDFIFMREANDLRKDYFVKKDLFNAYVRNNFNVVAVLDDRPQVLRLWHEIGIKTISMGNTFVEF